MNGYSIYISKMSERDFIFPTRTRKNSRWKIEIIGPGGILEKNLGPDLDGYPSYDAARKVAVFDYPDLPFD